MTFARALLSAVLLLVAVGCDDDPIGADASVPIARVQPMFAPAADPMDFGVIPFPDDLYLDDDGRIDLGRVPSEAAAIELFPGFPDSLRLALGDLDGFSVVAPVFFWFSGGALDPSSLPQTVTDSLLEDSSVSLFDVDSASPDAFQRVPVRVHWRSELSQLALRPSDGHPLIPGRRYAAVVTTRVLDDAGEPIGPSAGFAAIRDAAMRPDDPIAAEAYDEYTPVLSSLAGNGVPRETVAGLAVFTVQTVGQGLVDARALVWAGDPEVVTLVDAVSAGDPLDVLLGIPSVDEPGLDVPGGVAHGQIGWLIHGSFESPWLLSDTDRVHGRFRRDAGGALVSTRDDRVPFTITLPSSSVESLPVVVFQHGLGQERSSMLAVADALAASGYAVIAIDIPYHGGRADGDPVDARHNYGGGDGPDGFGDRTGSNIYLDYLGVLDTAGELEPFHPSYVGDTFRQSVVDLMSAVRVIREGDWSAVRALPGLELLSFSEESLGFIGISLGGIVGTVFVATEPDIGAAVLNVTGGDLTRLVSRSAGFSGLFLPILLPRVGIDPGRLEPVDYPITFYPEVALFQTLVDRGDSIAYTSHIEARPVHLLFQMAEHDETVPNSATEALVRAAGVPIIDADPFHTDLEREEAPVSENRLDDADRLVTRGLYVFGPATHGLLTRRNDTQSQVQPVEPPFPETTPRDVANPIDAALAQAVHFLDSWRSGSAEIISPVAP